MKSIIIALSIMASIVMTGCSSDADVASENLSKAADQFEVTRRIVFYNSITDGYMHFAIKYYKMADAMIAARSKK